MLAAPLHLPTPRWSSRSVAAFTGTSQSDVARVWARCYARGAGPLPPGPLRLLAVAVSPENSMLVLTSTTSSGTHVPGGPRTFMRSVRRPALQTVLASDLRFDATSGAAVDPGGPARDAALAGNARSVVDTGAQVLVVSRRALPALDDGCTHIVVAGDADWQRLLEALVRQCAEPALPVLTGLQHQLMQWARGGAQRFEWLDAEAPYEPRPPMQGPPPTARAVADEMFRLIVRRLVEGRLRAGSRLTEADLARVLRTSRLHVRDALRTLASDGLVDLEPHRGAFVPSPLVSDILETYAVRRALGAIVVRHAAQMPASTLAPVEQALERMLRVARTTSDSYLTGDADLDLQDVLAGVTGLRSAAPMFRTTTAQIKLYVAVIGLSYSYPIPDMCQDDIALVQHLRAHDEAAALRRWHAKVDAATGLMTLRLRQSRPAGAARPAAGTP